MDIEMAFNEHYHEVLQVIGDTFIALFKGLETQCAEEIAMVNKQYPAEPFKYLEPSLILPYKEGIAILRANGVEIGDEDDLSTPNEKLLGQLVKEKSLMGDYLIHHSLRAVLVSSGFVRLTLQLLYMFESDLQKVKSYIDAFKYGAYPPMLEVVSVWSVCGMLYLGLNEHQEDLHVPSRSQRITP
eukprot:Em0628g3a